MATLRRDWQQRSGGETVQDRSLDDQRKLGELQVRVDALLAGTVDVPEGRLPSPSDRRPFSSFLTKDQRRASALATLCMKVADEDAGRLDGLEHAIDQLYDRLGLRPTGMVEYATKLFLTHYEPARRHLRMRPLEERQPASVRPS